MAVVERLLARHGVAGDIAIAGTGLDLGKVVARDHCLHARQLLGRRYIDGFDVGMSMRATQDFAHEHAGQEQVGSEFGAPGHLVDAVVLDRRSTDDLELLIGVETAVLQDVYVHDHSPRISLAAACTERMILSYP